MERGREGGDEGGKKSQMKRGSEFCALLSGTKRGKWEKGGWEGTEEGEEEEEHSFACF